MQQQKPQGIPLQFLEKLGEANGRRQIISDAQQISSINLIEQLEVAAVEKDKKIEELEKELANASQVKEATAAHGSGPGETTSGQENTNRNEHKRPETLRRDKTQEPTSQAVKQT